MGIDSVVAIPLEDFSLDLVKPEAQCVKRDGVCIPFVFPNAPDGSVILPFVGPNAGRPATYLPARIHVRTSLYPYILKRDGLGMYRRTTLCKVTSSPLY